MSDPGFALQTALYSALSSSLSCAVYDHVPQGSAYPYVTLDYEDVNSADYLSNRKDERFVYLSVWSQYAGQKEVKQIMAEIDTALHNQRLSLSTGRIARIRVVSKRTNREPDAITYMGQVRLNIITEH